MEKRKYTVLLVKGTDEPEFLANEAAGMQVRSNLSFLDSLISMMLTDEEVATLKESEKVRDVVEELPVEDASYNTIGSPNYTRGGVTAGTTAQRLVATPGDWDSLVEAGDGEEFSPMALLYTGGATPTDTEASVHQQFGYSGYGLHSTQEYNSRSTYFNQINQPIPSTNEDSTFDGMVIQNYAGDYVDIVAVEAGTPTGSYDSWHEDPHPDACGWGANSSTSRFVPMNWEDYEPNLVSYNQVDEGGNYFSAHAIGVLSSAAGKVGGWASNASMRVVYLGDGVAEAMNAVLAWHQSKPVNPATGVRNATIVTGAWVYVHDGLNGGIPVDRVRAITHYPDGPNNAQGNPIDSPTIVNRGDPQPKTFNFTMTSNGSSAYRLEGYDRGAWRPAGSVLAAQDNPAITGKAGDTLVLDVSNVGSHPVEIIDYTTENVVSETWITGVGTDTITIAFPSGQPTLLKYRCELHPGMKGNIVATTWSSTTWDDDLSPFLDVNIAPRLLTDPSDSTDKWVIPFNSLFSTNGGNYRESTFDTILDNYDSVGGIYYFQSVGNSSTSGKVGPEHQHWYNELSVAAGDEFVRITLSNGQYQLGNENAVNEGSGPIGAGYEGFYPSRCARGCYSNEITVSAATISQHYPYLDGYSDRGPGIDISAPGSNTYGSYPAGVTSEPQGSIDQNGYRWGSFGGTSCAGPRAAGAAALMVDDFFLKRGTYPSIAQLKEQIQNDSKAVVTGVDFSQTNWVRVPYNTATTTDKGSTGGKYVGYLDSATADVYSIYAARYWNGGSDITDLHGNTNKMINVPWAVRLSTGKYMNHGAAFAPRHKDRPASGNVFPRRKKTIEV